MAPASPMKSLTGLLNMLRRIIFSLKGMRRHSHLMFSSSIRLPRPGGLGRIREAGACDSAARALSMAAPPVMTVSAAPTASEVGSERLGSASGSA